MGKMRRFLALFLAAALLLCGCGVDPEKTLQKLAHASTEVVQYEDMEYARPDMEKIRTALQEAREAAGGEDLDLLVEKIYAFYDVYDSFYTNYSLADIRNCGDLTDLYWSGEAAWCAEYSVEVDAALEELFYTLADSSWREALESEEYFGADYFDSYEGKNQWDDTFSALLERETELENQYYELSEAALDYEYGTESYYDACADGMMELLVELIRVRQEQAAYWGYGDYSQFATEFYYYRDYTAAEADAYLEDIRTELVPLYRELNASDFWDTVDEACTEQETFDYVRTVANKMGGTVSDAFALMEKAGLYDISYGDNKYSQSFEVYLSSYNEPFVFINPSMTNYDFLTFVHEFGHFCNDYASFGSYAGTDVMEVFSQGMEYLSLCYGEDTQTLTQMKMADSLCLYVEQAAFAKFEQEMYKLTGDDLTAENLHALYRSIALEYGFDSAGYDEREFVAITHIYTYPMYIISYVVSNDAAMQLYQMEQQEAGAGLRCMEENLDTQSVYFLEFLKSAGLESPFAEGRVARVRKTLEEALN